MHAIFGSSLIIAILVFQTKSTDCSARKSTDGTLIPLHNMCSSSVDAHGISTPRCVDIYGNGTWRCAYCIYNCDCVAGYYCSKYSSNSNIVVDGITAVGTCVDVKTMGKLGRPCSMSLTKDWNPTFGCDNDLLCGNAAYYRGNGSLMGYEWVGECVSGVCAECSLSPTIYSRAEGTISCPGTMCDAVGHVTTFKSTESTLSQYVLAMLIVIMIVSIVHVILMILKFVADRRRNYGKDRITPFDTFNESTGSMYSTNPKKRSSEQPLIPKTDIDIPMLQSRRVISANSTDSGKFVVVPLDTSDPSRHESRSSSTSSTPLIMVNAVSGNRLMNTAT